jgi:uncharacterized protein
MKLKSLFLSMAFLLLTNLIFGQKQFNVLLFSRTMGWHHESIKDGVDAIRELGAKHNFNVEWEENPAWFTDEKLKNYQAIIFLNTTGDIFNADQQKAMENFIKAGKGFVGIHSASDTEYDWDWYTKLVGRMFVIHPKVQTGYLQLLNKKFPGMDKFSDYHMHTDEWYQFSDEKQKGTLNYILSLDETTIDPKADWGARGKGEGMGKFHPIAWYQNYDGGRSFYTALGHLPSTYKDEAFLKHLYGGIWWAATGKGIQK